MSNFYVSSVAYAAVAQWAAATSYSLGQYIRQLATPTYGNDRIFKCTTAGISAAVTEPTWNKADGATTADGVGTLVWTQVAGREAEQAAGNWKAPFGSLQAAITIFGTTAAANVFISSDHSESNAGAFSSGNALNWNCLISVSRVGATLPPTDADYTPGASIATTGNNALTLNGGQFYGLTFTCGNGVTGSPTLLLGQGTSGLLYLEDCTLVLGVTANASIITMSSSSAFPSSVELVNTKINFSAVGQCIQLGGNAAGSGFVWRDTPSNALGGTVPTKLFIFNGNTPLAFARLHGLDLSSFTGTLFNNLTQMSYTDMWACKLNASIILPTLTTTNMNKFAGFRMTNCDDSTGARNYRFIHWLFPAQTIASDNKIAKTGGASDGVTLYSHRIVPIFNGVYTPNNAIRSDWINRRYNTTGSSKTLTVECVVFASRALTAADLWLEAEVLGSAGFPLASLVSSRQSPIAGSNTALTTSSVAWDTVATLRANTHTYVQLDAIAVASNPGRIFMALDSGNVGISAGSEPGGYATATDGTTVTDGADHFYAGRRYKLQLTITPQVAGIVRARVCQTFSGITGVPCVVCFDPKLTIA